MLYNDDDIKNIVFRILNDKELGDCGLTEENVTKTIESFNGDEIACSVFLKKYALRDEDENIIEFTLDESKTRWAKEVSFIETKFKNPKDEKYFKELYDYLLPAGRQMFALGNKVLSNLTLSNCYVTNIEDDSIEGIFDTAKKIAKTYSYGGGIGFCIGGLRPRKSKVSNSARHSTGSVSFMELYSLTTGLIGQCVAEGQRVLTKYGLKPIEQIKIGEEVWTKVGFVKVVNVFNNGPKEIFEITDKFGFKVELSSEHLVAIEDDGHIKEARVKELKIGDSIVLIPGTEVVKDNKKLNCEKYLPRQNNNHKNITLPEYLDEKLAYILGYSYGDGSVEADKFNEPTSLSLACSDDLPEIKTQLKNFIKEKFNYVVKISRGDGKLDNLDIHSKEILCFLKNNGILKQKVGQLIFPELIKESSTSVQMAFISGFYDADGKKVCKKSGYKVSITDYDFLKEIKNVLMSSGVVSKNGMEPRENWNDLYNICVSGTSSQELLLKYLQHSVKAKKAGFVSKRDNYLTPYKAKSFGIKYSGYNFVPDNSQYLSCKTFLRLKINSGVLIKSEIKSITRKEVKPTYDIELEKEHLFYCEGFYVHNSGRRGALMITIPVDHPDIEEFIEIKHNNINKVKHANISIKITDDFMKAVENDENFILEFKTKHESIKREIKAKVLWNKIVQSARDSAEPGILFWDQAKRMSPSDIYNRLKIESTNPCVTGDTLVYVADGRGSVPIKQLANEEKDVPVFCLDNKDKIAVRYMRNPRLTGEKLPVYKIILDDGSEVKATENHKLYLSNGELIKVKDLKYGDSLQSIISYQSKLEREKTYSKKTNYCWILNKGKKTSEHRLIASFYNNINSNYVVHHTDYNGVNNCPSNLKIMSKKEHDFFHFKNIIGDANYMRRAQKEWSKEKWENYKENMLNAISGEKNGRYGGITNEELKEFAKNYNHRVERVEFFGYEDVYNGTVDEFHNFLIGGFECGKSESYEYVRSFIKTKNCGEILLEKGGACVLSSLILHNFVKNPYKENAYFDFDLFREMIKRGVRHLDNVVELNIGRHALQEQNESAKLGRRIGLGITGLADMLYSMNIPYDSQESLEFVEKIMKEKTNAEYLASIELAQERGMFNLCEPEKHFEKGFCETLPENIKDLGKKHGIRNVTISTIAPNGSLSIMAQCSSGIEPIFAFSYKRYVELGNKRKEFNVYHQGLKRYFDITGNQDVPEFWKESHTIDYKFRVKMQGILQKYVDSSISSTINLPENVTTETVSEIYFDAWKEGLKGITVYREGSREGILVTDSFAQKAGKPNMDTIIHCVKAEGSKFYIMVSYKNGEIRSPYQVFVLNYKKMENDSFIKVSNGLMKMLKTNGVSEKRIQKYLDRSNDSLARMTRFISLSMKTNNLKDALDVLDEYSYSGTLANRLKNILSKSIEDKKMCENCHGKNVRMEEGCIKCLDCGWSKC